MQIFRFPTPTRNARELRLRRGLLCVLIAAATTPAHAQVLDSGITRAQVENRSYLDYTTEALNNLMTYGTDRYGTVQSNLLVSILDVQTRETVTPAFGDTNYRADFRFGRRSPQGSNFLQNQPLLRTMYRVADVTGDPQYANFADDNILYSTSNLIDSNGMFWWGWHRYYDVVNDSYESFSGDQHEMHFVTVPEWERMWAINPRATNLEIQNIWKRHVVDTSTGQVNRHDGDHPGVSFVMTSASHIEALAFLSTKLPGPIPGETDPSLDSWLERAQRLANYNYEKRDPTTNLVGHIPHQDSFVREDEQTAFTSMHLLAMGLLKAHEHTGDSHFLDQALTYLNAYATYGYDAEAETFWGTLNLDGTPDTSPRSGPLEAFPTGHVDFWQPNAIDREFPAEAAQSYADAFAVTGDATMKLTAERWAKLIRRTAATKETRETSLYSTYSRDWAPLGTYAEHYGRVIDFFLTMYGETGEQHYLFSSRDMAKDAISSLYYQGFFRGHPNKPYYEALDGVPLLLEALVELDQYTDQFTKFADFDNNDIVDLEDYTVLVDHWLQSVAPYTDGDVTGDGVVDLLDFSRFKHEYFEGHPSELTGPHAVPEPSACVVALAGGVLLYFVRCRSLEASRPSKYQMI